MGPFAAEPDIIAIRTALAALGIVKTDEELSILFDRPFLLVGSEEWLDRATLQLFPRMQTVVPEELLAFRLQMYTRLPELGVRVSGIWCADTAAIDNYLESCDETVAACIILWHTEAAYPVLQRIHGAWESLTAPAPHWMRDLATKPAPNGYTILSVAYTAVVEQATVTQRMNRAQSLLAAQAVFRFPTPNHPLRVYQAWHVGYASLSVIAFAAQEAAPLSIVSDTIAQVFTTFLHRAQHALTVLDEWRSIDCFGEHHAAIYAELQTKYLDIVYLFELVCAQFPVDAPVRALSLAEGALIAEVCSDARIVYGDIHIELGKLLNGGV